MKILIIYYCGETKKNKIDTKTESKNRIKWRSVKKASQAILMR